MHGHGEMSIKGYSGCRTRDVPHGVWLSVALPTIQSSGSAYMQSMRQTHHCFTWRARCPKGVTP